MPLKSYVKSFTSTSFAPSGITDDPDIRTASSLVDYIARRLALSYLSFDDRLELGLASIDDMPTEQTSLLGADSQITPDPAAAPVAQAPVQAPAAEKVAPATAVAEKSAADSMADPAAPMCYSCGNQTQKAGSCYVCTSCGSTTGCS